MAWAACPIIPREGPLTKADRYRRRLRTWPGCAQPHRRERPDPGQSRQSWARMRVHHDHVVHHRRSRRSQCRVDRLPGAGCRAWRPGQSRVDEPAVDRRKPLVASVVSPAWRRLFTLEQPPSREPASMRHASRDCAATDAVSILQGQDHRHPGKGHHRDYDLALPRMRSDVDDREPESVFNPPQVRSFPTRDRTGVQNSAVGSGTP